MKYRKKPVVIEAIQWTGENYDEIEKFCGEFVFKYLARNKVIVIKTLEGNFQASPNDWIIKGIKGEFYPCKPDIFKQTYEPV